MDEKQFNTMMETLNDELYQFWPCPMCYYGFGCLLGFLSLGITCICPCVCIHDARKAFKTRIIRVNATLEQEKSKVRIRFEEKCPYRSWIIFEEIRDSQSEVEGLN
jgi:hypothetical protein